MPHISLGNDAPGILSLFEYRPETARPLCDLAEVLLRGPGTLSRGERELIAAYVSSLNECRFCAGSHSAFAAAQLPGGMPLVDEVRADAGSAGVSVKLGALLPDDPAGYAAMAELIVSVGYGAAAGDPVPQNA